MRKGKKSLAKDLQVTSPANGNGSEASSVSRRKFLGKAGGATAALAAAGAGLPSLLAASNAPVRSVARLAAPPPISTGPKGLVTNITPVSGETRKLAVFRARLNAAVHELKQPLVNNVNNGDEALYANDYYIGNCTKELPHDNLGQVIPSAYQAELTAVQSGNSDDFAAIPLGGTVPLIDPQAGLNLNLEGADFAQIYFPPFPTLASPLLAAEMVENYWLALARDVPFSEYGNEPITAAAIADLNSLPAYTAAFGTVTAQNLFRGFTPGDTVGPYVSQFLMMTPCAVSATGGFSNYGLGNMAGAVDSNGIQSQLYYTFLPGVDYMTDQPTWLAVQNGQATNPAKARSFFFSFGATPVTGEAVHLHNGRDFCCMIHVDELFQHYLWAAAQLLGDGFPASPGSPYLTIANQIPFSGPFGGAYLTGALGEAAYRGVQCVWYHKWFVQRTLRPEEYAGWVQNMQTGAAQYPLDPSLFKTAVMNPDNPLGVFQHNLAQNANNAGRQAGGTYYLPMAFQEGCPNHPSYGSGHATVAGASVTLLKAFFNNDTTFESLGITPMYSPDGVTLQPYTGSDAGQITVGTELDKIASNIGIARDIAGVHWHSDYMQSLLLGEAQTISLLQELVSYSYQFKNTTFQFNKFDGTPITISA